MVAVYVTLQGVTPLKVSYGKVTYALTFGGCIAIFASRFIFLNANVASIIEIFVLAE